MSPINAPLKNNQKFKVNFCQNHLTAMDNFFLANKLSLSES